GALGLAVATSAAMAWPSGPGEGRRRWARASRAGSLRGGRRGAALGAAGFAAAGPRCEDAGPRGGVGPRGGCGGVRIKAQNRLGSRKTPRQPLAAWRLGF